jgi:hypothetical protein
LAGFVGQRWWLVILDGLGPDLLLSFQQLAAAMRPPDALSPHSHSGWFSVAEGSAPVQMGYR